MEIKSSSGMLRKVKSAWKNKTKQNQTQEKQKTKGKTNKGDQAELF